MLPLHPVVDGRSSAPSDAGLEGRRSGGDVDVLTRNTGACGGRMSRGDARSFEDVVVEDTVGGDVMAGKIKRHDKRVEGSQERELQLWARRGEQGGGNTFEKVVVRVFAECLPLNTLQQRKPTHSTPHSLQFSPGNCW